MSMQDRMAAASQRVQKLMTETKPAKPAKPRIRVRMGGVVTEDMLRAALGIKPKAVQQLEQWLENSPAEHRENGVCPHCRGTGRYRFHTDAHRNEKCYRCHGKGRLDGRDLAFYSRRIQGAAPICHISSAAAA